MGIEQQPETATAKNLDRLKQKIESPKTVEGNPFLQKKLIISKPTSLHENLGDAFDQKNGKPLDQVPTIMRIFWENEDVAWIGSEEGPIGWIKKVEGETEDWSTRLIWQPDKSVQLPKTYANLDAIIANQNGEQDFADSKSIFPVLATKRIGTSLYLQLGTPLNGETTSKFPLWIQSPALGRGMGFLASKNELKKFTVTSAFAREAMTDRDKKERAGPLHILQAASNSLITGQTKYSDPLKEGREKKSIEQEFQPSVLRLTEGDVYQMANENHRIFTERIAASEACLSKRLMNWADEAKISLGNGKTKNEYIMIPFQYLP